jgi:hypothetical protein
MENYIQGKSLMTDFKQAQRKNLRDSKARIEYLRFQFDRTREEISKRAGEDEYDIIANILTDTIIKLDSEIKALPLRHVYHGTFYIRKPYTTPIESLKVNGRAEMREDLVSWEVYNQEDKYIGLCREVFKDSRLSKRILREDGEAVFENDQD